MMNKFSLYFVHIYYLKPNDNSSKNTQWKYEIEHQV